GRTRSPNRMPHACSAATHTLPSGAIASACAASPNGTLRTTLLVPGSTRTSSPVEVTNQTAPGVTATAVSVECGADRLPTAIVVTAFVAGSMRLAPASPPAAQTAPSPVASSSADSSMVARILPAGSTFTITVQANQTAPSPTV